MLIDARLARHSRKHVIASVNDDEPLRVTAAGARWSLFIDARRAWHSRKDIMASVNDDEPLRVTAAGAASLSPWDLNDALVIAAALGSYVVVWRLTSLDHAQGSPAAQRLVFALRTLGVAKAGRPLRLLHAMPR